MQSLHHILLRSTAPVISEPPGLPTMPTSEEWTERKSGWVFEL